MSCRRRSSSTGTAATTGERIHDRQVVVATVTVTVIVRVDTIVYHPFPVLFVCSLLDLSKREDKDLFVKKRACAFICYCVAKKVGGFPLSLSFHSI